MLFRSYTAQSAKGYIPKDPLGSDYHATRHAGMSGSDKAGLEQAGVEYNQSKDRGDTAGMEAAHAKAEAIRDKYGYSGGADGSEYIPTGKTGGGSVKSPRVEPLEDKAPDLSGFMDKWLENSVQQQENKIDYGVEQGVKELERAQEDAQDSFQTQHNQVDAGEAKALDNQALYAEARGDRGGIGQAQYGEIQAAAMANRRAINTARSRLATDTARAIADLRAQGQFEKADAVLELTQSYLEQMMDYQQWGAEFNLDVNKFNAQLDMWEEEFALDLGQMMGEYQGVPTLESQKIQASLQEKEQQRLAQSGFDALALGVRPTAQQQAAMGYTDAQVAAELTVQQQKQSGKTTGKGSSTSKTQNKDTAQTDADAPQSLRRLLKEMYRNGIRTYEQAKFYLRQKGYTVSDSEDYAKAFYVSYESGELEEDWLEDSAARQQEYDKLRAPAKELLSAIQRQNERMGVDGMTDVSKRKLQQARKEGAISDGELEIILELLGV